ncbi:S1C family serine protease [Halomarina oriensis]|uniref:Trypsin-like serine protease n=1 Tax=Halomarina oriensis TaxID=671145 RepID=A0A6B0GMA7_9EURY|nr:trypsin-like peptidase domain-containing protein [Halomarina oriensis]MWG33265.1 trypsin-like serine protease [Halomarina oriensis]
MSEESTYQQLYRTTIPSVVSIYIAGNGRRPGGSGSGFVHETADGEWVVVTNQHVVGRETEVDVRFADGRWRVGEVVGSDASTDLAVVRVPDLPDAVEPLVFADENPVPGTHVAALGNPMGLDGSLSVGVVSGASRSMVTRSGFVIPDTVQTDAPINPGNSGGPLVALDGRVVGINRARGGDNIGFAVSAEVAARVVPSLVVDGEYRHPYLGVRTLDVSPSVAQANRLERPRGVLVVDVADGPASGVLRGCRGTRRVRDHDVPAGGDVVVSIDGDPVDAHEQLMRYLLLETRPGDQVTLELLRRGARIEERVRLGERPMPGERGDQRGRGRRRGGRDPRGDGDSRRRGTNVPVR